MSVANQLVVPSVRGDVASFQKAAGFAPGGIFNNAISGTNPGGLAVAEYGTGQIKTTVFTLTAMPFTMTDNGTNGSGNVKLYTFPKGLIFVPTILVNLTIAYAAVSDGNVISALGSVAAAADGTLSGTEANFIPSTVTATVAGAGTFSAVSTGALTFDNRSAALSLFVNMATSTDPTTNNSIILSGTITLSWLCGGDA